MSLKISKGNAEALRFSITYQYEPMIERPRVLFLVPSEGALAGEMSEAQTLLEEAGYEVRKGAPGETSTHVAQLMLISCHGVALMPDWDLSETSLNYALLGCATGLPTRRIEEWLKWR